MANTTVFQFGPMGGNYTISRDSVGYVWTLPIVVGSVIPTSGVNILDAYCYMTMINHTSNQRQARIDLENIGTLGGPFVTLGDGSYGPLQEPCVRTLSMYAGVNSMAIRVRGNGTGGTSGTCFSLRSDCSLSMTVVWEYTTSVWRNDSGLWRKSIDHWNDGGLWRKSLEYRNDGGIWRKGT